MPQFICQKDTICYQCKIEIPRGADIWTTDEDVFCSEGCLDEHREDNESEMTCGAMDRF